MLFRKNKKQEVRYMSIVRVNKDRNYLVRKATEAEAVEQVQLGIRMADQFNGQILKETKLKEGAYLMLMYFMDPTRVKDWETRTGISNVVPTAETFIVSDDNDFIAQSMCSKAKDQATKCSGTVLLKRRLEDGIYLLSLFFQEESLKGFWETSLGVR